MSRDIVLFLVILCCLITRFYFYHGKPLPFRDNDKIRISSNVRSEPLRYDTSQYLRLQGLKIYLPLYPEISYGDKIVVEGVVAGDKLQNPKLVSIEELKGVYIIRKSLIDMYRSSLPEPHASLIAGVSIGAKSGMPSDFWDALKKSGTAHVVVASGMNVTLIAGFLISVFTIFLKRGKALVLALVGVWTYAVLSGFDAPIVRAAIMGSIAFSAQELGKINIALRALILSGALMLIINPGYLADLGFWLSFAATLSLILFEPKMKNLLSRFKLLRGRGYLRKTITADLSTTLAAQIGAAPILYYFFGTLNILSPLVNVLVLWTIVPITLIGIVGGLVGLVVPIVGKTILLFSYPFTLWFTKVVEVFS